MKSISVSGPSRELNDLYKQAERLVDEMGPGHLSWSGDALDEGQISKMVAQSKKLRPGVRISLCGAMTQSEFDRQWNEMVKEAGE